MSCGVVFNHTNTCLWPATLYNQRHYASACCLKLSRLSSQLLFVRSLLAPLCLFGDTPTPNPEKEAQELGSNATPELVMRQHYCTNPPVTLIAMLPRSIRITNDIAGHTSCSGLRIDSPCNTIWVHCIQYRPNLFVYTADTPNHSEIIREGIALKGDVIDHKVGRI